MACETQELKGNGPLNTLGRFASWDDWRAARDWLARKGYDPLFGARPMARLIQTELKDRIADDLLFGPLASGGTVKVDVEADRLVLQAS